MTDGQGATEVVMPKLGLTMERGVVAEWLHAVGATVREGEPLVEVATEKIETIVDAPGSGTLTSILVEAEVEVPVGTVIGLITPNT